MNLTGRIPVVAMAACATIGLLSPGIQAQAVTSAERMASIRSQQMARNAMITRQNAATAGQTTQYSNAAQPAVTQRAAAQRSYTAYGAAPSAQASMNRGVTGVRPTASGASMVGIRTALHAFAVDMGRMPTSAEGLGALLNRPPGAKNWRGPYISSVNWHQALTDPWGNAYRYFATVTGRYQQYTISSDGPDRMAGTTDDLKVQF